MKSLLSQFEVGLILKDKDELELKNIQGWLILNKIKWKFLDW